ncbi:MAG: N-acetyltransferase [Thaumarchaeota archaeon 13_1_40CM_3_38_6]|nr:MAG: N-acetyltransferase [Thaumarchaeota archaeon 13_1_40CM_3_38_6]
MGQRISGVTLKEISEDDLQFLYKLLKQRDPNANISHKVMPSYDEHVKFVTSKPYSKWYVMHYKKQKIGSIYLTKQNEIGIFILNGMRGKGAGEEALRLLIKLNPRDRYLANVSPKNKKSIQFFKKNGFNIIQHTYELTKNEINRS